MLENRKGCRYKLLWAQHVTPLFVSGGIHPEILPELTLHTIYSSRKDSTGLATAAFIA